jgi:hypothetical protein
MRSLDALTKNHQWVIENTDTDLKNEEQDCKIRVSTGRRGKVDGGDKGR